MVSIRDKAVLQALNENEDIMRDGCLSQTVLGIIASRWTVMVMHALQGDTKRYNQLTKTIGGISQKVLTDTLRKLERDGIVRRTVYPVVPPKTEYALTPLGLTLLKVTDQMAKWTEKHIHEVIAARSIYDDSLKP
jgi:DNA-binding HxlR family transcriptional regulator